MRKVFTIWPALVGLLGICACSSGNIPVILKIDTPNYHVATGKKMLEFSKIDSAAREFSLAIDMDPKYSPAHVGIGLTEASKGNYAAGMAALKTADRFARGKDQEIAVFVGYMRFYTIGTEQLGPDWLRHVEKAFDKAILIATDDPGPYFYMGLAYKTAGKLDQAAKKFYRVLELDKGYIKAADREYAAIEAGK